MRARGHPFASWFWSQHGAAEYNRLQSSVWLLMILAEFADWQTGAFDYSQTWVARELGVSRRTIIRLQQQLVKAQWVRMVGRGRYGARGQIVKWPDFKKCYADRAGAPIHSEGCEYRGGAAPEAVHNPSSNPTAAVSVTGQGVTNLAPGVTRIVTPDVTPGVKDLSHNYKDHDDHEIHAGAGAANGQKEAFALWEKHFSQSLTPGIEERLERLNRDYPTDWLAAAFEEATRCGARAISYVERILQRWQSEGFGTTRPSDRLSSGRRKGGSNGRFAAGSKRPEIERPAANSPTSIEELLVR